MVVDLLWGNYMTTILENGLCNILWVLHPEFEVHSNPFLDEVTHNLPRTNMDSACGHVMMLFFVTG
jgi:hypothetical protein